MHLSVCFDVVLGRVFCVLLGMGLVAMGEVGVVGGRFVISVEMMFRGFAVMARSVFVVLRCLGVVPSCFVRHEESSRRAAVLATREDYREL
ncbi:MAG TPA: hypothetical protein VK764_09810 [Terracidiphilus sp.]|nr:hypothetical protein [Terracidiphilus sp.]